MRFFTVLLALQVLFGAKQFVQGEAFAEESKKAFQKDIRSYLDQGEDDFTILANEKALSALKVLIQKEENLSQRTEYEIQWVDLLQQTSQLYQRRGLLGKNKQSSDSKKAKEYTNISLDKIEQLFIQRPLQRKQKEMLHYWAGLGYREQGSAQKAARHFFEIHKNYPKFLYIEDVRFLLQNILVDLSKYKEAEIVLGHLNFKNDHPYYAATLKNKSLVHLEVGKVDLAIQEFKELLDFTKKNDPKSGIMRAYVLLLPKMLYSKDQFPAGKKVLEWCEEYSPDLETKESTFIEFANLLRAQGSVEKMNEFLEALEPKYGKSLFLVNLYEKNIEAVLFHRKFSLLQSSVKSYIQKFNHHKDKLSADRFSIPLSQIQDVTKKNKDSRYSSLLIRASRVMLDAYQGFHLKRDQNWYTSAKNAAELAYYEKDYAKAASEYGKLLQTEYETDEIKKKWMFSTQESLKKNNRFQSEVKLKEITTQENAKPEDWKSFESVVLELFRKNPEDEAVLEAYFLVSKTNLSKYSKKDGLKGLEEIYTAKTRNIFSEPAFKLAMDVSIHEKNYDEVDRLTKIGKGIFSAQSQQKSGLGRKLASLELENSVQLMIQDLDRKDFVKFEERKKQYLESSGNKENIYPAVLKALILSSETKDESKQVQYSIELLKIDAHYQKQETRNAAFELAKIYEKNGSLKEAFVLYVDFIKRNIASESVKSRIVELSPLMFSPETYTQSLQELGLCGQNQEKRCEEGYALLLSERRVKFSQGLSLVQIQDRIKKSNSPSLQFLTLLELLESEALSSFQTQNRFYYLSEFYKTSLRTEPDVFLLSVDRFLEVVSKNFSVLREGLKKDLALKLDAKVITARTKGVENFQKIANVYLQHQLPEMKVVSLYYLSGVTNDFQKELGSLKDMIQKQSSQHPMISVLDGIQSDLKSKISGYGKMSLEISKSTLFSKDFSGRFLSWDGRFLASQNKVIKEIDLKNILNPQQKLKEEFFKSVTIGRTLLAMEVLRIRSRELKQKGEIEKFRQYLLEKRGIFSLSRLI